MQQYNPASAAGPSRLPPQLPRQPFVSADYRPPHHDGIMRVVLITSGSVASIKMPLIAGALSRNANIALQIVATEASTHFYTQGDVNREVQHAQLADGLVLAPDTGVKVWTDPDEWSDWKKVGDPILHIELRRWADLVVVAPCSADFLAKVAGGHSDNLALSLLRALPSTTPVILCPAMNTAMYAHRFTAKHLKTVQEELDYMISGPQGTGKLACGDDGPGKMTDWRDIVTTIQDYYFQFMAAPPPRDPIPSTSTSPMSIPEQAPRDASSSSNYVRPIGAMADSSYTARLDGHFPNIVGMDDFLRFVKEKEAKGGQ